MGGRKEGKEGGRKEEREAGRQSGREERREEGRGRNNKRERKRKVAFALCCAGVCTYVYGCMTMCDTSLVPRLPLTKNIHFSSGREESLGARLV